MNSFSDNELTLDNFLGGRVHLSQPHSGYRAGIDPVLLAASVPAHEGQSVLELGCGSGAAILCLMARVPKLTTAGIELQPAYAALAHRNADQNAAELMVVQADLNTLPDDLRQMQFDHVIANPPYYRPGAHSPSIDPGRRIALGEDTPLADWIDVASRRLASRAYLHMIQKADRLPEMLAACAGRLGSIEVLPLSPRTGRSAELVILRARKGGRAAFRLHAPLVLHRGERHVEDGESYSTEVTAVLREGAALTGFFA